MNVQVMRVWDDVDMPMNPGFDKWDKASETTPLNVQGEKIHRGNPNAITYNYREASQ